MANPELGSKQICPNCQTKFYDLARRPAHCPKCALDFDPEEAVRSRRVRARSTTPDYEADDTPVKPAPDEDAEGFEEEAEATPEIDDAAAVEPVDTTDEDGDDVATPADDIGVDFEEENPDEEVADDVPFLEDEDDDLTDDDIALPDDEEPPEH